MNRKLAWVCVVALTIGYGNAWAQDEMSADEAETTIRLMEVAEAELPDAVTKEIELPATVLEDSKAVEKAQHGNETANENRQRRGEGRATAEQARERGAEIAEQAQENRENRGRSGDKPEKPDKPDVPNNQGPPND